MQLLGFENGFLGRLQYGVEVTQDAHRQNDVRIFATLEQVGRTSSTMPQIKEMFFLWVPWSISVVLD
jgi:hypothetical protein